MEDIVLLQEEDEEAQVALRRAAGLGGEDSEDEEDDVFQLDELNLVDQSNTDPVPRKYVQSTSGSLGVAMHDARCTRAIGSVEAHCTRTLLRPGTVSVYLTQGWPTGKPTQLKHSIRKLTHSLRTL